MTRAQLVRLRRAILAARDYVEDPRGNDRPDALIALGTALEVLHEIEAAMPLPEAIRAMAGRVLAERMAGRRCFDCGKPWAQCGCYGGPP